MAGRVKKLSYPNYVEDLSYDAVGNILAINEQKFGYDTLYRLTNYQKQNEFEAFSYDGNANRLSKTSENNTTYGYKTGTNQLSKIEKIDKNSIKTMTNFLYDENGNLLKDASHEYIYDKKARLVSVDNNVSYAYNHENTRVSKTVNAEITHFIYDGAKLIGEYNSDGSVKNEYIYLNGTPLAVISRHSVLDTESNKLYYIHTDHLGIPRRLADENANIVWSWESKAFGDDEAVGSVKFNLRFAGQYYDDETTTHYNINRDYNPQMGRYIQSDPIGFDGGVNSYGYVGGNPLGAVDELGLKTYVVVNLADNHIFRYGGWHVGMVIIGSTQAKSFYYDPTGGFQIYPTQSGGYTGNPKLSASSIPSLDMDGDPVGVYLGGKNKLPISLALYQQFQGRLGTKIHAFSIKYDINTGSFTFKTS
jgi:RHS repeat-associated protein